MVLKRYEQFEYCEADSSQKLSLVVTIQIFVCVRADKEHDFQDPSESKVVKHGFCLI